MLSGTFHTTTDLPSLSPLYSSPIPSLVSAPHDLLDPPSPIMAPCNEVTWISTNRSQYSASQSTSSTHELSPAGYLECYQVGISAQNASRQDDLPTDVDGCLSPSALIAQNYRSRQSSKTMENLSSLFFLSDEHVSTRDASCEIRTMWEAPTTTEDSPVKALGRRSKSSLAMFDRLCNAPPVIVDASDRPSDPHMVLERFRRNPHNIVLDSLDPENAPHIVITPAEDTWANFKTMEDNHVGIQYWPWLPVPPFFGTTCRLPTYEEYTTLFYAGQEQQDVPQFPAQPEDVVDVVESSVCTATAEIPQLPEDEDNWRSFVNDLTHILMVHSHKLAAFAEVTLTANTWRERYNKPSVFESVDRPFEWIDPAKFILADTSLRCPRTSFVIQSDVPFIVPHIIIHLAPENDPAAMAPYVNVVQDSNLLTVPLIYSTTHYGHSYERDTTTYNEYGSFDITDELSDCDTESSGPRTPTLQRIGSGFFSATTDTAGENIVDGGYKDYKIPASNSSIYTDHAEDQSYTRPATKFFISSYDDDFDTDSLPDIDTDEWFIQARAGSTVISTSSF